MALLVVYAQVTAIINRYSLNWDLIFTSDQVHQLGLEPDFYEWIVVQT